jgi:hypothetical protein
MVRFKLDQLVPVQLQYSKFTNPSAPVPSVIKRMLGPIIDLKFLSTLSLCFKLKVPWMMSCLSPARLSNSAARSSVFFQEENTILVF